MNTNVKRGILIFGGGYLLYFLFKKLKPIEGKSKKKKELKNQLPNARTALAAYRAAVNDGQNTSFLNDMNIEFMKKFGLKVIPDKSSGTYIVVNQSGDKIL